MKRFEIYKDEFEKLFQKNLGMYYMLISNILWFLHNLLTKCMHINAI